MVFFRGKKPRPVVTEPLPDWDDTRWRSHLRANALGTEHHCGIYVQMINDDRKEAARLFKNEDTAQARNYAESALRHNRTVTALAALSPLSNALYQRAEPLAGYTSLVQIPEPARSGIVTIVFAAGRLHMNYLSETVLFLREQFGPLHIEAIQRGEGELYALVNPTVRDALSPAPSSREDIDTELASAVKQYFGIAVVSNSGGGTSRLPRPRTGPIVDAGNIPVVGRPGADGGVTELRRAQTTPLSALSSDGGMPISPQISDTGKPIPELKRSSAGRGRMYAGGSAVSTGVGTVGTRYQSGVADLAGVLDEKIAVDVGAGVGAGKGIGKDISQIIQQVIGGDGSREAGTAVGIVGRDVASVGRPGPRVGKEPSAINRPVSQGGTDIPGVSRALVPVGKEVSGVSRSVAGVGKEIPAVGREIGAVSKSDAGVRRVVAGVAKQVSGVSRSVMGVGKEVAGVGKEFTGDLKEVGRDVERDYERDVARDVGGEIEGLEVGRDVIVSRDVIREGYRMATHLKEFKDSDEALLERYDHLCVAISA